MSASKLIGFIVHHPLSKRKRVDAVLRFLRWQIGSRLVPGAVVFNWVNNSRFLVHKGETGLTGNIYTGLHEFADMGYLLHVLRPVDTFIDVGANMGSYTILASAVIGAHAYAFEPIPNTYRRLIENVRLNNAEQRTKTFNIGLAALEGTINFTSQLDTTNHASVEADHGENVIAVPVNTLDNVLGKAMANFLKVDVEGYETQVLSGAVTTLENPELHSVIMELNGSGNRYGYDESKILTMMLDYGFGTFAYDPLSRELISLHGKNQLQGNTLFIKNEDLVRERISTAPKFRVFDKCI